MTDTVGFIRRLPTQLVEGFAATLEETLVADLVLHVADASAPVDRLDEMVAAVESVLHEIGADEIPVELVLNKIDAVDALGRRRLANRFPGSLQISARTGEGLDELRARLAERFSARFELVRLLLPYDQGGLLAELYASGAPIDEREDTPTAFSSARACRTRRCGGSRRTSSPRRRASRSRARDRARDHPPAPRRGHPRARLRGRRGARSRVLRARRPRPRRARDRRHGPRGRDPGGTRRLRPAPLRPRRPPRDLRRQLARTDRRRLPRRAAASSC